MTFRAVLFDAGGTLLFLDFPRIARAVGAACGIELTEDALRAAAPIAARELERAGAAERERAARYLKALLTRAGLPERMWDAAQGVLRALHRERHLWGGGDERTSAALASLRAAGMRLGVVSNGDGRVAAALDAAGLGGHFEVVVDSRLAGVEKPDPRIFQLALERLGVAPSDALYVGDVYEVDVVGARRAGLAAALVGVPDGEWPAPVPSAPTVADLVEILLATGQLPPSRRTAGAERT